LDNLPVCICGAGLYLWLLIKPFTIMNLIRKLFFAVLFLPIFSYAQYYQPGAVVNLKGDTLHGFIKYSDWDGVPKNIFFKIDTNNDPVKYTVKDIKYFNVAIGYLQEFQRYEGPVTTDNIEINHLFIGKDTGFRIDTVFLRVMLKGKNMTLFSYKDNIKTRYFVSQNADHKPKELIYRIYFKSQEANGRDRTAYDRTYLQQLTAIAAKQNDPDLMEAIAKTDYTETDLLKIAAKINGIADKEVIKNATPHHSAVKFIVFAAVVLGIYFFKILK
jgi:hypothetical protein